MSFDGFLLTVFDIAGKSDRQTSDRGPGSVHDHIYRGNLARALEPNLRWDSRGGADVDLEAGKVGHFAELPFGVGLSGDVPWL